MIRSRFLPKSWQICTKNIASLYPKYARFVPKILQICTKSSADLHQKYGRLVSLTWRAMLPRTCAASARVTTECLQGYLALKKRLAVFFSFFTLEPRVE